MVLVAAGVNALLAMPANAQTPGPVSPPATASVQAPLPNRLNTVLPKWLRVRGEFRERMEGVDNAAFTSGRDDLFWLSRLRLNASVTPAAWFGLQVQVQDARVAKKQIGTTASPFKAVFDVRMAFADVGKATGRVAARVGRQELAFGEQRLLGHVNWINAARTFDAGRVTVRSKKVQLDLFAASVVRILPDAWDQSGNGNRFYGAHASSASLVPKATFEPYVFWRGDRSIRTEGGATGSMRQVTTGLRWVGVLPAKFEYGVETALQTGSVGADDISAWASHLQIKTPAFGPSLRFTSEYNFATGDANATDGTRGTFDQLYPTPHDKYGLADQVGWRNVHHMRAGVDVARIPRLPVSVNYHTWWLANANDALYMASGAVLARVTGGAARTHVGHELDVQVTRALTPQLNLAAGYAYIRSGAFLKEATPGASYSTPFVMLTYVFLAER
jgi:hypothetical protein